MRYFFIRDRNCDDYWYVIEGNILAVTCGKDNQVYYDFGNPHLLFISHQISGNGFNKRTGPKFCPHTFNVEQYIELDDLMNNHFADML